MNLSLISKNLRKYPVLVVCGLMVPLSLVLLSMRAPKIQFYEDEQASLEKRWNDIQTNVERSNSLSEDIEDLNSGLSRIQSRLMNVDEVASNYEFFYGLERQSGIKVERFSLGLPFDGSGLPIGKAKLSHFSAVPCQVSMSGSIQEILNFMDLLDRQDFIVHMDLLNVVKPTTGSGRTEGNTLSAQLRCYVLASKDE